MTPTPRGSARALLDATRPRHAWKNVVVFAGLLFGHRATAPGALASAVGAFLAFWAASSAGYLVNDVVDRDADRHDPTRANRAIASGEVSVSAALVAAGVLAALALVGSALLLPIGVAWMVAAYLATTLLYTFALRRVPVLGVASLALGFVWRAAGGAAAVSVAPSPWLLGLTAVLAAGLALAKRRQSARRAGDPAEPRLARATDACLLAAILGYAAWTQAPETLALHGTRALAFTAIPVLFALLRFRASLAQDEGAAGPAEVVARDPVLVAWAALWALACAAILHLA